jgi:hypothetical protein
MRLLSAEEVAKVPREFGVRQIIQSITSIALAINANLCAHIQIQIAHKLL